MVNYKIKVIPFTLYKTGLYLNKILKKIISYLIRDINKVLVWLS